MSPFAQQLVVFAAVAVAAGWLLRKWLGKRSDSSCDRCEASRPVPAPKRAIRPASLRVLR